MAWTGPHLRPADLGVQLLARGFNWPLELPGMARDLRDLPPAAPLADGVRLVPVTDPGLWQRHLPPFLSPDDDPQWREIARARWLAMQARPRRIWQFAALAGDEPVGTATLHLTAGPLGAGGIYDVGVTPAWRSRGIGGAVTLAACRQARDLGCRVAVLGAAQLAVPLYRRLGFRELGTLRCWRLPAANLAAATDPVSTVAATRHLVLAAGRGEVAQLASARRYAEWHDLEAPLPCGLTLVELAALCDQPACVEWLVAHGATLDVISATRLGWHDRVPELLADHPDLANRRCGRFGATPLHLAAMTGDLWLARLLVQVGADKGAADLTYHSPPAAWAMYFGHQPIVQLLAGG